MISYNPLWKTLIDKGYKKTDLIDGAKLSSTTIADMGKNSHVNTSTIEKICEFLDCKIPDVIEYIPDNN